MKIHSALNKAKELLTEVYAFKKQHEYIKNNTYCLFNIFETTRIETKEVTLHSNFIKCLIDPLDNHQKGYLFQKLLLERLNINDSFNQVEAERTFDNGRIDLILENENSLLIIENKINAKDQPKQLERYDDYARTLNKDYTLIYLTLDGHSPSKNSLGSLNKDKVKLISYHDDILPWLATIIKECADHPTLRETLFQYIKTVEKITGTMENELTNQIVEMIKENDSLVEAYLTLTNHSIENKINSVITNNFIEDVKSILFKIDPNAIIAIDNSFGTGKNKESYIKIDSDHLKDYQLWIGFINRKEGLVYGLKSEDRNKMDNQRQKTSGFIGNGIGFPNWLWLDSFENYNNWNNKEVLLKLYKREYLNSLEKQISLLFKTTQRL